MGYKKQRLATKIVSAARTGERYRDIHVFVGGTGAVGGTALLQMLSMYEEMMSVHAPLADDVPILVTTGLKNDDLRAFTHRLFRFVESRHGPKRLPIRVAAGYLTHSGVFVALERFQLTALPGLEVIQQVSTSERVGFVQSFLSSLDDRETDPFKILMRAISKMRPISTFLRNYQTEHFKDDEPVKFRSVTIGIPIPSLVAYHLGHLEEAVHYVSGLTDERVETLVSGFRRAFRDDLDEVRSSFAEMVLVAHTTAVGGMYDEHIDNGKVIKTIRLGFAHSAQDTRLITKQHEAEEFTKEYAQIGIKILITAAAIGIDEVRIRAKIPLHNQIAEKLRDAPFEVFPGAQKRLSDDTGKPITVRHFVGVYPTITIPLDTPSSDPVSFQSGKILRPTYSIRSGENGFFTVANADALYRVMRVASASELGQLLATVGLFGDDPNSPWFLDNTCYYTESDNSRQVFDLLYQSPLLQTQISGLEPLALQDLGSSKHQGELHTLSLLILLHRVRTLNIDAIDPYVDLDHFDPSRFFIDHSRPLVFEDLENWHIETLSREMQILVSAESPEDLRALNPNRQHSSLFPLKDKAFHQVLACVLEAVRMVPSLGSPILFERDGKTFVRTGYFVAPLDLLVTNQNSITTWLQKDYASWLQKGYSETGYPCSFEEYRDYHICTGGFVDLRPIAILCTAKNAEMNLRGKIKRLTSEESLSNELANLEPYSFFTTCGLVALLFRLKGLYRLLREAMAELGTLHEFRWQMPRDMNGHIVLVPGVVEAFRMVAEGLEKATGVERVDGIWGYERRPVPERWHLIPGVEKK